MKSKNRYLSRMMVLILIVTLVPIAPITFGEDAGSPSLSESLAKSNQMLTWVNDTNNGAIGSGVGQVSQVAIDDFQSVVTSVENGKVTATTSQGAISVTDETNLLNQLDNGFTSFKNAVNEADKSTISSDLDNAVNLITAAVEGTNPGDYGIGSKAAFQTAIDDAMNVKEDLFAKSEDVVNAVSNLATAKTNFESTLVPGGQGPSGSIDDSIINISYGVDQDNQSYIEFKTTNAPSGELYYAGVSKLSLRLGGSIVPKVIFGDNSGYLEDILQKYNVKLIDLSTSTQINVQNFWGQFRDVYSDNNTNTQDNNTNILEMNLEFNPDDQNIIKYNETYRIVFTGKQINEIVNGIMSSVYATGDPNLNINIADNSWNDLARGKTTFTNAVNADSNPPIEEFNVDSTVQMIGSNIMRVELGDLTNFTTIKSLKLAIDADPNSQLNLPTKPLDISVGNVNLADVSPLSEANFNGLYYPIDLGSSVITGPAIVVIENKDSSINLRDEFREYFNQSHENANLYLNAYDSTGNLVAYKVFDKYSESMYVNPMFEFETLTPPFTGFYYGNQNDLKFDFNNTGVQDSPQIIIEGRSTYDSTATDFIIKMQNQGDGNYSKNFSFINKNDNNFTGVPDTIDMNQDYWQIPVNIFASNSIVLSKTINAQEYTKTFTWKPDNTVIENFFNDGNVNMENQKIGLDQTDIYIDFPRSEINLSKLKVEIEKNIVVEGVSQTVKIAEYLASTSENIEIVDGDNTRQVTRIHFSENPDFSNTYNELMDYDQVSTKLIYTDSELSLNASKIFGGNLRIDNSPPNPNMDYFDGKETIDGVDYYKFAINLNDEVDLADMKANFSKYFAVYDDKNVLTSILPVDVQWYRPSFRNDNDPFQDIKLYFDEFIPRGYSLAFLGAVKQNQNDKIDFYKKDENLVLNGKQIGLVSVNFRILDDSSQIQTIEKNINVTTSGAISVTTSGAINVNMDTPLELTPSQVTTGASIFVYGLSDNLGNKLVEERIMPLDMSSDIIGYIVDADGNFVVNTELSLVPIQKIPVVSTDTANDYYQEIVNVKTNKNGKFTTHIYPGEYLAYQMAIIDDNGRKTVKKLDFIININIASSKESTNMNISIPESNVTGNVVRLGDMKYKETIVLIDSAHLQDFINATDPNNHEDRWKLMDIIKQFYIKEIKTDGSGSFDIHLRPGSYELLGKFSGDDIVTPLSVNGSDLNAGQKSYSFVVPSSGATSIDNVVFPPPTVQGYIKTSGDVAEAVPVSRAWVEVISDNGIFFNALTDDSGYFSLTVKEVGNYKIKVVRTDWDYNGAGKLFLLNGAGAFAITEQNTIDMANGTYTVQNLGTINMPSPNMVLNYTVDGDPISDGEWSSVEIEVIPDVEGQGEFRDWIQVPTRTAQIELYLPDGNYGIRRFNSGPLWYDVPEANYSNYNFSIPSDSTFEIDLGSQYNTTIQVKDEDGAPMEGYRIEIEDMDSNMWFSQMTNASGNAYFNIDVSNHTDGNNNIKLHGYSYKEKWYEAGSGDNKPTFEVLTTNNGSNKKVYNLVITKPNFRGKIYNLVVGSNGEPVGTSEEIDAALLTDGHFDIRKIGTDGANDEWFGAQIDSNGNFEIALTNEGQYMIEGASGNERGSWFEINKRFDVKLIEGKYVLVDPVTFNPWTMPKNIGQTPPNFTGYLFRSATFIDSVYQADTGIPYDGGTDENQKNYMQLREKGIDKELLNISPWMYEKWVEVNNDGSFAETLDETKNYEVVGVGTPRRYYEFAEAIDITIGSGTTNYIVPPKPNFNGVVKGFGNLTISNLRNGRVELEYQQDDFNQRLGTEIDETGSFGMSLEDGKTYIIRELWYETEETVDGNIVSKQHRMTINKKITVGSNSSDLVLAPNLKVVVEGVVTSGNIPSNENDNNYHANITPVLNETDFQNLYDTTNPPTEDGEPSKSDKEFDRYKNNPWEFGVGLEGKYETDGNIYFYSYLDDGDYKFDNINGYNLDLQIDEPISLSASASTGEGLVYANGSYTLTLGYTPNVTGSITENGVGVGKAWVNIQRTDVDYNDWTINRMFGTKTNDDGTFSLKLKEDGDYRIEGYNTEGYWQGTNWVNGKWSPLGYNFKIVNGVLADSLGNPLSTISLEPNVVGEVFKIFKDYDNNNLDDFIYQSTPNVGDYAQIKKAWISIWPYELLDSKTDEYGVDWDHWDKSIWTETDENGLFKLMLDDGKYIITEVGMNNFRMTPEIVFTVSGGQLVSNGHTENGKLIIKPDLPNFKGLVYSDEAKTKLLKLGWFKVVPKDVEENDWKNIVWINTDREGNFESKLDDGDYNIVEMGNYNFWNKVNIPIKVTSGNVTSTISNIITDGQATIFPPAPNLKGIVKDKSGNSFFGRAWITIKPADAGENDFEKAIWSEYKLHDDGKYYFALNLEQGNYKVVEVGSNNFYYNSNVQFTIDSALNLVTDSTNLDVNNQLVLAPPTPNISGIVYGDIDNDGVDDVVSNARIGFARFTNNKQVTLDGLEISDNEQGYDEWANIYWQHTRWTETNENGEFAISLPSGGTYRVIGVAGQGLFFRPNTEITIVGNETYNLEIKKRGPNVTFNILNVPTSMIPQQGANVEAWLDVYQTIDGEKQFMPVEFVSSTNGTFTFNSSLLDGDYKVAFFGTAVGGAELEEEFTVNGTTVVPINLGEETGKVIVSGSLMNQQTAYSEKMWVKFSSTVNGVFVEKKIQTDENGQFTLKLDAGTTWTLVGLSGKDGAFNLSGVTMNYDTGTNLSTSWNIDISTLLNN
ncbi:collagen binding domain-containing protein [Helicovermis profundi]|uniref:Uncharacterized protein n=1 Tax=Helicovermis profundi TaxID=3065157 RepID=A0AAU9E3F5_9FIRM|nr:hypothetical protein HLPR_00940 [Clostridia bacterium S502]